MVNAVFIHHLFTIFWGIHHSPDWASVCIIPIFANDDRWCTTVSRVITICFIKRNTLLPVAKQSVTALETDDYNS